MPDTLPDSSRDRTLLVKQVRAESPRVVTLTLVDPTGGPLPSWEPGAHLDLVLPSGTTRQYSLCGDNQDKASYTVAVQHEPAGRGGSREVHTTPLVGKYLTVRGPRNRFPLVPAENHFLIAGGIGITPILAMARALERTGQRWHVLYCGRGGSMPFLDELRAINANRVTIAQTDQTGRPNVEAFINWLPEGTAVYCCGPSSLTAEVVAACTNSGSGLHVHVERFIANPDANTARAEGETPITIELARSGLQVTVRADQTILDSVREVCPDVPFSCEEGYCGTCETRVLDGIPDHRDEVLGANEHGRNQTMMICVSRAKSERLVLDL